MQRKRLEDMNLLDDFLFNAVMTFPGIGERFCRLLLQVVLGREIGRLRVVAQRAFGGRDEGFRGARLDVLAEEELMDVLADPSVFDIEPDNNGDVVSLKDLPKRVRFYHAIIDSRCLKKGEGFGKLKRVFVIFVCSYDPFDRGRMVYTIRNMCEEIPEMEYDDGMRTVFLNTKGDGAGVPEELVALLRFMEDTREVNAVNDVLRELLEMVRVVKDDGKVTVAYMKSFEIEQMWINKGIEQGISQGIAQGIEQGIEPASATELQAAMTNVETNLGNSYKQGNGNKITATTAGVYAIKATTTDTANYVYSPMAAFVSFKPYTNVPTELKDETVNAKRTTIKIEKSSDEADGVVEINKEVTYTVRTNVPYISDAVEDKDVSYTITDTIEGADYSVNDDGKLVVSVQIGAGAAINKIVDVTTLQNGKKQFVLDLSDVAKVRTNANADVVISYKAIVKSEVVNNSVVPNDGTHTFTPKINTLYTGKITMTKTDDGKEKVKLANAGFVIYRVDGEKTYYALVSKDAEKKNNEYVVTGWTERFDTAKADDNLIITDTNGEAVVRGLDDSYTYNFKEIKAPEGYSVNTTDSVATWGTNQTAENRTGTATMSDTKLNSLPSTGGMGTYLFTIIGVVVMAGAAGAFFISRRKGSEE